MFSNYSGFEYEAGCDEAGRGCLAGPVVAAAVIFRKNYKNNDIIDSKKLSEKKRNSLAEVVKKDALHYAIATVDNNTIDKINILNASILAMHKALDMLPQKPEFIIVDGNKFKPYHDIQHKCIVKGDDLYLSIAAASILAKTYRDKIMCELHQEFPFYNWDKNKGYPTKFHRMQIKSFGLTKHHRNSFKLL
ncbi:MAG: ribonuclease HII [Bacteroidales bacterium]